ncbi:MAG: hypothetical protein WA738_08915 [Candidatus Angelobacter sp.]
MKRFLILAVILCVSTFAAAQKADAAFVVGGSFVSDTTGTFLLPGTPAATASIKTDHHIFLEGALGVRLLNAHLVSLHAELPVAGIPSQPLAITGVPTTLDHLSTIFITPGLRLKILPVAPISPWVSIGGGWARYSLKTVGLTQNKGAIEYGGGLDFKTGLPLLGFRAEVRDFVTGDPNFGFTSIFNTNSGLHHHNILAGGGIVLRF